MVVLARWFFLRFITDFFDSFSDNGVPVGRLGWLSNPP